MLEQCRFELHGSTYMWIFFSIVNSTCYVVVKSVDAKPQIWRNRNLLYRGLIKSFVFLKNIFIYLFIYLFIWLCWVFVAARGLSLVAASGSYSSLCCAGSSLQWLLLLGSTGSRCAGFSSCSMRAQ